MIRNGFQRPFASPGNKVSFQAAVLAALVLLLVPGALVVFTTALIARRLTRARSN